MILWINMQVFDDLFGGLREFVYFCRRIVSKIVNCIEAGQVTAGQVTGHCPAKSLIVHP